jgi:hypothetical protein
MPDSQPRRSARLAACGLALACTMFVVFGARASAAPEASDRAAAPAVRQAQVLEAEQTGVPSPVGLAFSARGNSFYVVGAGPGAGPPTETDVVRLTPSALRPDSDRAGLARIAAALQDPINMAYDVRRDRLLLLGQAGELLELQASPQGDLDPKTLNRRDAGRFGLRDPQGLAVDPVSGTVFILDANLPRLVRLEPAADGWFEGALSSEVDLRPTGVGGVRGLALDPSSGHLQLRSGQTLHELTTAGEMVASRDLSGLELSAPQAMAFAPSGDLTDDPAQMSVYVADSGTAQGTGQIVELALSPLAAIAAIDFTASLVNTIDTAGFSPPSPDPSGLTYLPPPRNTLLLTDGEVEETVNNITHFQGVNVWETTLGGNVVNTGNVSKVGYQGAPPPVPMTQEPVGVTWEPSTGHYFVSEDGGKRVYNVDPGADGKLGTSGDSWTFFSTLANGNTNSDPEGIAYDTAQNHLFVADGVNAEVYEYTTSGTLLGHFDVARYGVGDPETVEYNAVSDTLFVLSNRQSGPIIVETTKSGALLQTIDVSSAADFKPAGLAYAPASNGTGVKRFYFVDRGIDNNNDPRIIDGKIFEFSAPSTGPPVNNAPFVDAGPDQTIALPANATLDGTVTDDGLPNPPGAVTTTWTKASGPGTVTFGNANAVDTIAGFSAAGTYVLRLEATDSVLTSNDTVTITVSVTADLIFADGFESGSFSAWSASKTGVGDLSVTSTAALLGTFGMQGVINDNTSIFVTDSRPSAESRYRARSYFDPNSIPMATNDRHYIFHGRNAAGARVLRVEFRWTGTQYEIRAALAQDTTSFTSTAWFAISDAPHPIELDWQASTAPGANNGSLTLWIDGLQRASLTGVDNDTRRVDDVRLGAVAGIDTGTRRTYYFDDFASRRVMFIGP